MRFNKFVWTAMVAMATTLSYTVVPFNNGTIHLQYHGTDKHHFESAAECMTFLQRLTGCATLPGTAVKVKKHRPRIARAERVIIKTRNYTSM